jgi:hypothetical protein
MIHIIRNKKFSNIFDIELEVAEALSKNSAVEFHVMVLPYNRNANSQSVMFYPYEEYVGDIQSNERCVYATIPHRFNRVFGILLSLCIAALFAVYKPNDLLSVQSIIAVLGAFTIGRDVWDGVESSLISLTRSWKINYISDPYPYKRIRKSTLAEYSAIAEKRRYGKASLLAYKMDFIEQSSAQTVRLLFRQRDIHKFTNSRTHLMSMHIKKESLENFFDQGFMYGIKCSLNKRFLLLFNYNLEIFESTDKEKKGCLNAKGTWIKDSIFVRKTFMLGRIKIYLSNKIIKNVSLLTIE